MELSSDLLTLLTFRKTEYDLRDCTMEDLRSVEDRADAGNVAALSEKERDEANRACLENGPAFSLRYRGELLACGGLRLDPGKDYWFLWINPTKLVAQHKTMFHRAVSLLWAALRPAIEQRLVVAAVHQTPEYYGRWARHFGFRRIGEAEMNVRIADGSKYDLYVFGPWPVDNRCSGTVRLKCEPFGGPTNG